MENPERLFAIRQKAEVVGIPVRWITKTDTWCLWMVKRSKAAGCPLR
jgi:hypothetical protein